MLIPTHATNLSNDPKVQYHYSMLAFTLMITKHLASIVPIQGSWDFFTPHLVHGSKGREGVSMYRL